jgi:hypothetical protein
MAGGQKKTPARGGTRPGRGNRYATAAGTSKVAQTKPRAKQSRRYCIRPENGEAFSVSLCGRDAWALMQLTKVGFKGLAPLDKPAPRWSAYIHRLRQNGIPIETLREKHGGEFPGYHARYVLRAKVTKGGAQ